MLGRWYLIIAVIVLTFTIFEVFSFSNYTPQYASTRTSYLASCTHSDSSIAIIADSHGYNNSISHISRGNPWPVIAVHRGDLVTLTFCNLDTVEAHGFAIDTYFDRGVILLPGNAYQISFIATEPGSFRIFCINFCSVHRYMSGTLIVS
jgi:heme/copper-type cytochrome/quinol oxidase subunit 2